VSELCRFQDARRNDKKTKFTTFNILRTDLFPNRVKNLENTDRIPSVSFSKVWLSLHIFCSHETTNFPLASFGGLVLSRWSETLKIWTEFRLRAYVKHAYHFRVLWDIFFRRHGVWILSTELFPYWSGLGIRGINLFLSLGWSTTVTALVFTKLTPWWVFVKHSYTEFHEKSTRLVASTRPQTDRVTI
jgi:hypothetical protein